MASRSPVASRASTTALGFALRWLVRLSACRPWTARRAAVHLQGGVVTAVLAEISWAFKAPRAWLSGVAFNLVLAAAFLVIAPIADTGHDWVIMVGAYFSSFIMADVTTTNVLGADHIRVQKALEDGVPLGRLLAIKNLAQLVIVGVPTLLFVGGVTVLTESADRVAVTIPDVAVPIVCWLGVGNVVSVLLPVAYEPLRRRWMQRRQLGTTVRWLVHLVLPYALFYLADPVYGAPGTFFWRELPDTVDPALSGVLHLGCAVLVWLAGTAIASVNLTTIVAARFRRQIHPRSAGQPLSVEV